MIKKFLVRIYREAGVLNLKNILDCLERNKKAVFVDLGCGDGEVTIKLAKKIGIKKIYGVDIKQEKIRRAKERGIIVKKFDLNKKFEFKDNVFDIVHANQVLEHLPDSDNFLSEVYRILKRNGYAIISTENASSWCNIFASLLGWQIFSLTNFSGKKYGLGNPLAIHKNDKTYKYWNHVRIYNIRGLKEYLEIFGFKVKEIKGAGYFPLWASLGNIDKVHCHFITFKIVK